VLGVVLFVVLAAAIGYALLRVADRAGLLLPVAVGLGVRALVTTVAHVVTVANGHHGFLYFDDHGYAIDGHVLADLWSQGHPGNLLQPLGTLPHGGPLFFHLVAGVFLMTGDSVVAMKAVNVLAGAGTVLVGALLAGRLLGTERMRPAAWALALAPTLVWWTAPMLREATATFLAVASVYAATYAPRWRGLLATLVLLTTLAFFRSTLFAGIGAGVLAWWLAVAVRTRGAETLFKRATTLVLATVAVAGVALYVASGSSGNPAEAVSLAQHSIHRFQNSSQTKPKPKPKTGAKGSSTPSATPASDSSDFESPFVRGIGSGGIKTYAAAAVRFFVSPRAWAFTTVPLDWYQPLYPAMWLWYLLLPVAALGLWRLRRRLDVLALLVVPIVLLAAQYTLAIDSGVRQRSGIEPLAILLIVAGWQSWAVSLRRGAAVLLVLAPIAALDLHSALAGVLMAAGAAGVYAIGRRLPQPPAGDTTTPSALRVRWPSFARQ